MMISNIFSRQTKQKKITIIILALALLICVSFVSLSIGRYHIPISDLIGFILGKPTSPTTQHVIMQLRLPRLIGAILVGAALSISGATYQNIFQNPLVSPDLLGVSSGSCAGAALAILLGVNEVLISAFSFFTGMLSVIACVGLAALTKRKTNLILVFAGIIVGRFMDSLVGMMKYFADAESQLGDIVNWQLGTLSKISMSDIKVMVPCILLCLIAVLLFRWRINILSLGEKEAATLGVNVVVDRTILIILSTILTAVSVCFCGTISWVGLIIPHISRWLIGSDNRYSMPLCLLFGSGFMVVSDLIARAATDYELPLSVITGLIGAPIFAVILLKSSKGREFI